MYSTAFLCFTELAFDKLPDDLLLVIERRLTAIALQVTKFYRVKKNTHLVIFER